MARGCGSRKPKCARPGRLTRNPFLNFLRVYRKQNCGKSMVEIACDGAKVWNCMSPTEKCKYIGQAFSAKKKRRRRRKSRCGC